MTFSSCLQYNMKLLRKNSPEKEEKEFVSNIIVTNDILKQCEKNVSFEDTSKFFIQSGRIYMNQMKHCKDCWWSLIDNGRVDFIVGGTVHTVLLNSLYSTLQESRLAWLDIFSTIVQNISLKRIGKLLRARTLAEVLTFCDKYETEGRCCPTIMFDR